MTETTKTAADPRPAEVHPPLGRNGHPLGHQPHGRPDSRAAVPVPRPLHAEDIAATLGVARSNVSTSLRELQGWGIVRVDHILGDRRDHFESMKDVWEMFRIIVDERKKREADPTLAMLREAVAETTKPGAADALHARAAGDMLQFFELMTTWCEQTRKLPTPAVIRMVKMGDKVAKLLGSARQNNFAAVISVTTEHTDMTGAIRGRSVRSCVASVWLFHGLFNKLLHGSPRHLAIVQSVPGLAGAAGQRVAHWRWALSRGRHRAVGPVGLGRALLRRRADHRPVVDERRSSLPSPASAALAGRVDPGQPSVPAVAWVAAESRGSRCTFSLRRHPIPDSGSSRELPDPDLRLPPRRARAAPAARARAGHSRRLRVCRGRARANAEALRPAGLPGGWARISFSPGIASSPRSHPRRVRRCADFDSPQRRGSRAMVAGGNLLTHYNYHRCDASVDGRRRSDSSRGPHSLGDGAIST